MLVARRRFIRFCLMHRLVHDSGDFVPASEGTLIYFASYLAGSVCHSTIRLHLAALCNLHISCGNSDPLVGKLLLKSNTRFCVNQLLLGFSLLCTLFSVSGCIALTSLLCGPLSHLHFWAFSAAANSQIKVLTSIVPALKRMCVIYA